jgi:hypothetical protein
MESQLLGLGIARREVATGQAEYQSFRQFAENLYVAELAIIFL